MRSQKKPMQNRIANVLTPVHSAAKQARCSSTKGMQRNQFTCSLLPASVASESNQSRMPLLMLFMCSPLLMILVYASAMPLSDWNSCLIRSTATR